VTSSPRRHASPGLIARTGPFMPAGAGEFAGRWKDARSRCRDTT
jgi:hypothetical protein